MDKLNYYEKHFTCLLYVGGATEYITKDLYNILVGVYPSIGFKIESIEKLDPVLLNKMDVAIKRVYEPVEKGDGQRILIDRLWPRGLSKEKAKVDLWFKDIAPSTSLRKWFAHDSEKWPAFQKKYLKELESKGKQVVLIQNLANKGKITLVYGAKEEKYNDAVVLRDYFKNLK